MRRGLNYIAQEAFRVRALLLSCPTLWEGCALSFWALCTVPWSCPQWTAGPWRAGTVLQPLCLIQGLAQDRHSLSMSRRNEFPSTLLPRELRKVLSNLPPWQILPHSRTLGFRRNEHMGSWVRASGTCLCSGFTMGVTRSHWLSQKPAPGILSRRGSCRRPGLPPLPHHVLSAHPSATLRNQG